MPITSNQVLQKIESLARRANWLQARKNERRLKDPLCYGPLEQELKAIKWALELAKAVYFGEDLEITTDFGFDHLDRR